MPVILATQDSEIRMVMVQSHHQNRVMRPYFENTHHKKGLVESLKVKVLSSSPSTTKKKKKVKFTNCDTYVV
jgi:hypothetical protein